MGYYEFPHTRNYDQDLGYLIEEYQRLIKQYDDIQLKYQEYTDKEVAKALETMRSELAVTVVQLQKQYDEFKEVTQETLDDFRETLRLFEIRINQAETNAQAYTDNAVAQYDVYIKNYIANQLIDVKVVNYFTGAKVTIQAMFDYLAQFHLTNAISYLQLANRNITYVDYVALNMTYTELAINGGTIIPQH